MTVSSVSPPRKMTAIQKQIAWYQNRSRRRQNRQVEAEAPPKRGSNHFIQSVKISVIALLAIFLVVFTGSVIAGYLGSHPQPFAFAIANIQFGLRAVVTFFILLAAQIYFALELMFAYLASFAQYVSELPVLEPVVGSSNRGETVLHFFFLMLLIALTVVLYYLARRLLLAMGTVSWRAFQFVLIGGLVLLNIEVFKQKNLQLVDTLKSEPYQLSLFSQANAIAEHTMTLP